MIEERLAKIRSQPVVLPKRRPWRLSIRGREALDCYMFILPAVLGLVLFSLGPMIASLYISFTECDMLGSPEWIGA